ncbi:hypothetical protein ABW19_dt0204968 [Dactylella cylindrospora]|nr:hypothetical protein ABW19_dt0204968 [Dactylella cylindrospora]
MRSALTNRRLALRASNLEIQKKVADELQRLQSKEDKITEGLDERISKESEKDYDIDRVKVGRSIATLSEKLSAQSKYSEQTAAVSAAETAVVRCLRLNDRRPLDCWKEVEAFKREVAKLEDGFVGKVIGDS